MKYKRDLLNLSGEALDGEDNCCIKAHTISDIAR